MRHFITTKCGTKHSIDEYGYENGHAYLCIDNIRFVNLKMYFREERTWDDHMGNTPCGYYVTIPFQDYYDGAYHLEKKRYYINFR